ncbi:WbqC family protein [Streptomyces sp. NPDC059443]|uniref:WbqC family protein n=1 Tax=unclassified Streptomyces TaxID=2593676 RepID=UPI0036A6ED9C
MKKQLVIAPEQPAYLPWCGYFSRLLGADQLLLADHVQYSSQNWQNRNYVSDGRGGNTLLTIPVGRGNFRPINEVVLSNPRWQAKHWASLRMNYARAPYWSEWKDRLEEIYTHPWERLVDVDEALIRLLCDAFGIDVEIVRTSTLAPQGAKSDLVVEVCRLTDARVMRIGTGTMTYLDTQKVAETGTQIEVCTYTNPPYGKPGSSAPNRSALDLVLQEGPGARQVLERGARNVPLSEWRP